jgi:hypothetical protein
MFCFISYNESTNIMLVIWVYDAPDDEIVLQSTLNIHYVVQWLCEFKVMADHIGLTSLMKAFHVSTILNFLP